MACSIEHYKDSEREKEHRKAARLHIALLKFRGEEVDPVKWKKHLYKNDYSTECVDGINYWPDCTEIQDFCEYLRECGGSKYTGELVVDNPTNTDIAKIHAWCLEHDMHDAENRKREIARVKRMMEVQAAMRDRGSHVSNLASDG